MLAVFTMIGKKKRKKKIMQFGIFVFVEAQEINSRANLQGGKCDGDCIFFLRPFFFFLKGSFPF